VQAAAACSSDRTYSGQTWAAILRQKKAYFFSKAQSNCVQVSPAPWKHCKATAWWAAVSSPHPRASAQLASQDAFPSRRDHRLPRGSGTQGCPAWPWQPCPGHKILANTFPAGL